MQVNSNTVVSNLNADMVDGSHASSFASSSHNHWGQTWSGSGVGLELSSGTVDWVLRGYCSSTGAGLVGVGNGPIFGGRGAIEAVNINSTGVGVVAQGQNCGSYHYAVGGAGMQANGTTCGMWATAENTTGTIYGVNGRTYSSSGYGVYGWCSTSGYYGYLGGGSYGVYYSGGLAGSGTKSCVMRTSKGPVALYCQESPENWFEDFGSGKLVNGKAHIELEKLFLETVSISDEYPIKVFLQQTSGEPINMVVSKSETGFDVIGPAGSNVDFDYRVIAKRKGFEQLRLERVKEGYSDPYLYPNQNDPEIPEGLRIKRTDDLLIKTVSQGLIATPENQERK